MAASQTPSGARQTGPATRRPAEGPGCCTDGWSPKTESGLQVCYGKSPGNGAFSMDPIRRRLVRLAPRRAGGGLRGTARRGRPGSPSVAPHRDPIVPEAVSQHGSHGRTPRSGGWADVRRRPQLLVPRVFLCTGDSVAHSSSSSAQSSASSLSGGSSSVNHLFSYGPVCSSLPRKRRENDWIAASYWLRIRTASL